MTDDEIKKLLDDATQFANNAENGLEELHEMERHQQFLLEQYRTDKGWFGPSIEDIIKTSFEYGWQMKSVFDIKKQTNKNK